MSRNLKRTPTVRSWPGRRVLYYAEDNQHRPTIVIAREAHARAVGMSLGRMPVSLPSAGFTAWRR